METLSLAVLVIFFAAGTEQVDMPNMRVCNAAREKLGPGAYCIDRTGGAKCEVGFFSHGKLECYAWYEGDQ